MKDAPMTPTQAQILALLRNGWVLIEDLTTGRCWLQRPGAMQGIRCTTLDAMYKAGLLQRSCGSCEHRTYTVGE